MKKKLKDFFNSLEAMPEVKASNCKKDVQQLRSYYSKIEKEYPYADERCYKQISKKVLKLQNLVSDANAKSELRKIQSKCDQSYHKQEIEQKIEFYNAVDWALCWCSEDD
ncbi:MAG: hypothetical protein K5866_03575 [Treponema sp.]|nr:hypothetical protein [Treponema sp.]